MLKSFCIKEMTSNVALIFESFCLKKILSLDKNLIDSNAFGKTCKATRLIAQKISLMRSKNIVKAGSVFHWNLNDIRKYFYNTSRSRIGRDSDVIRDRCVTSENTLRKVFPTVTTTIN